MNHHLHLFAMAYGLTTAPERKVMVDTAVRRWAETRTKGLSRLGVETFLRLTELSLKRKVWGYAANVAEIRAEFAKIWNGET